jgi:hypothetical protein
MQMLSQKVVRPTKGFSTNLHTKTTSTTAQDGGIQTRLFPGLVLVMVPRLQTLGTFRLISQIFLCLAEVAR